MNRAAWTATVLLLAWALPAAAQWKERRHTFVFLDNHLTIDVTSDASGVLRVIRGESGLVEVHARAPHGVPAFGLGGRDNDQLNLTALGTDEAEYVVVVPSDAYVRVRLPGRVLPDIASQRKAETYKWSRAEKTETQKVELAALVPSDGAMFLGYVNATPPRTFTLVDLENVSRLEIRLTGEDFRVSTSRAISMQQGSTAIIQFRSGAPELELVLSMPPNTREFTLLIGEKTALEVRAGQVRSLCDEVIVKQTDGVQVISYVGSGGNLTCR